MGGDGARQALEVVSAFEQRNNPALAAFARDLDQTSRDPSEIRFTEIDMAEGVEPMGVEARRDDDEIGTERLEARQDRDIEGFAKDLAAVAGVQGRIDDLIVLAAFAAGPGAGKERHLMGRTIHRLGVVPENLLGAIAVMDVEIDNSYAFGAMGARAWRAATAALLKKQKPIGVSISA